MRSLCGNVRIGASRAPIAALSVVFLVAFALLASVPAAPARAQGIDEPAEQEGRSARENAVALYLRARTLYEAGRYREAAEDLERARVLDPVSPTLAYNIARVYELLGELERSIESYRRHLALLPEDTPGEEREEIESTIRRLEGALASGQVQNDENGEPTTRVVIEHEPGVADGLFFGVLGGGGGLAVIGFALGGAALALHGQASAIPYDGRSPDVVAAEREDAFATAEALGVATDVLIGTGLAAMAAGAFLYFLRDREVVREEPIEGRGDEETRVRLEVAPSLSLAEGGAAGRLSVWGAW